MEGNPAAKVFKYRWFVFCTMALAYIFVYFHRQSPAVVANDLQETFETSAGLVGVLASAYFYPYAVMQFPAGLLSDSLGPRKTATIFLMLAAVGSFIFGLAPSVEVAVVGRVLVGLGVSMVFISTMKIISQWFRVSEFSYMAAILNVTGGVGILTAAAPLAWMTGRLGWRDTFQLVGMATAAVVLLVGLVVRNRPQDMGWPSLAEIDHIGPGHAAPAPQIPLWQGAKRVVTEPHFWALVCWFFLFAAIFFGFAGLWAGPYLMHVYGMTRAEAGSVLNMIALGLIVGSPIMSFLSERVMKSRKKPMLLCAVGLVAELVAINLYPDGFPHWALYLVFFSFCVVSASIVPVGFTATKELFPVEIAGTSVGTMNLFPFVGAAVMQILLGKVLDLYPKTTSGGYPIEAYSSLLMVLLGTSILALICSFFLKETFGGRN